MNYFYQPEGTYPENTTDMYAPPTSRRHICKRNYGESYYSINNPPFVPDSRSYDRNLDVDLRRSSDHQNPKRQCFNIEHQRGTTSPNDSTKVQVGTPETNLGTTKRPILKRKAAEIEEAKARYEVDMGSSSQVDDELMDLAFFQRLGVQLLQSFQRNPVPWRSKELRAPVYASLPKLMNKLEYHLRMRAARLDVVPGEWEDAHESASTSRNLRK